MEGPTPVSALIHAATMVAAGVYMLVRVALSFKHQNGTSGCRVDRHDHAVMAALIATHQTISNAFSPIPRCRTRLHGDGCGSRLKQAAMFDLSLTRFPRLSVFCAGWIVMLHHEQDIWKMGGLRRKLPITFATFGAVHWH